MTSSVRSERFEALDSWRGICALMVAVFHFSFVMKTNFLQSTLISNAYLFVDFFFVLSGFVVCHAYRGRLTGPRQAGGFILRRFGRLWPLHAALLMAMMIAVMAINVSGHYPDTFAVDAAKGNYSLYALVLHALLLTSVGLYGNAWNSPAWSIGAEFYTYLLFAAVVVIAGRRLLSAATLLVALSIGGLLLFAPSFMNSTADFGFLRCIAGFFAGVAAYHIHERTRDVALPFGTVIEVAAVALAGLFMVVAGNGPDEVHALSVGAPLVFGAAILVFAREGGALSRALHVAPLRALGRWSYSLYMVHMPLLLLLSYGVWLYGDLTSTPVQVAMQVEGHVKQVFDLGDPLVTQMLLAGFLAAVVAVAAATYRAIEEPSRDHFNRLAKRYEAGDRGMAVVVYGPARRTPQPIPVRAGRFPMRR